MNTPSSWNRKKGTVPICAQHPSGRSGKWGLSPFSAAFTLVELWVVITIIGILIALLLPAVQAAREAARRAQCANNLKQITLGILNYESQWGTFPINMPQEPCGENILGSGMSWMIGVLPYVELDSLYSQFDLRGAASSEQGLLNTVNRPYIIRTPGLYLCPSDDSSGKTRTDIWKYPQQFGVPMSTMNYAGVMGPHQVTVDVSQSTFGGLEYCNNLCVNGIVSCAGTFWRHNYMAPVKMSSFKDGTSNTVIVGEVVPEYDTFKVWALANGALAVTSIPLNYVNPAGLGVPGYVDHFGFHSRHSGGAQFALADGSVTFLNDTINTDIYRGLSTRAGGELVQPPN